MGGYWVATNKVRTIPKWNVKASDFKSLLQAIGLLGLQRRYSIIVMSVVPLPVFRPDRLLDVTLNEERFIEACKACHANVAYRITGSKFVARMQLLIRMKQFVENATPGAIGAFDDFAVKSIYSIPTRVHAKTYGAITTALEQLAEQEICLPFQFVEPSGASVQEEGVSLMHDVARELREVWDSVRCYEQRQLMLRGGQSNG
jgi:hypothetical protein